MLIFTITCGRRTADNAYFLCHLFLIKRGRGCPAMSPKTCPSSTAASIMPHTAHSSSTAYRIHTDLSAKKDVVSHTNNQQALINSCCYTRINHHHAIQYKRQKIRPQLCRHRAKKKLTLRPCRLTTRVSIRNGRCIGVAPRYRTVSCMVGMPACEKPASRQTMVPRTSSNAEATAPP